MPHGTFAEGEKGLPPQKRAVYPDQCQAARVQTSGTGTRPPWAGAPTATRSQPKGGRETRRKEKKKKGFRREKTRRNLPLSRGRRGKPKGANPPTSGGNARTQRSEYGRGSKATRRRAPRAPPWAATHPRKTREKRRPKPEHAAPKSRKHKTKLIRGGAGDPAAMSTRPRMKTAARSIRRGARGPAAVVHTAGVTGGNVRPSALPLEFTHQCHTAGVTGGNVRPSALPLEFTHQCSRRMVRGGGRGCGGIRKIEQKNGDND